MFTFGATSVVLIAAVVANVDTVTVSVDSEGNFIGEEIFVALVAKQILLVKAVRANVRAVVNKSHLDSVVIFLTMLAEAVIFVETTFADMNTLAVSIENVPSFGAIVLALLTEFAIIVVAVVAKKFVRKFAGARNAKSVSPNIESLEVVLMVLTNGNFSLEVWMNPVRISAEAVPASDTNVMFVAAIFFGFPEIGYAFKLGNFALNQIAIKF